MSRTTGRRRFRRERSDGFMANEGMMSAIRDARKAAGLTQQGVTDALGIPRRTLQDWEAGKRTPPGWAEALVIEKLKRIAQESQAARPTAAEK